MSRRKVSKPWCLILNTRSGVLFELSAQFLWSAPVDVAALPAFKITWLDLFIIGWVWVGNATWKRVAIHCFPGGGAWGPKKLTFHWAANKSQGLVFDWRHLSFKKCNRLQLLVTRTGTWYWNINLHWQSL